MIPAQPTDTQTTVQALLDAAQLRMSNDEFELFVKVYPPLRAGADSMYLPETRDEDPSLVYDAAWTD